MPLSTNTLLIAFTLTLVISSSLINAKHTKRSKKFKKWRCNYDCMTDFDMCVSSVKSIEEYIICHSAQGICKWHCLNKKQKTNKKLKEAALKTKAVRTKAYKEEILYDMPVVKRIKIRDSSKNNKKVVPTQKKH